MADLIQSPGLFAQIRLVAGLRWRILRNGLRKKSNRLDLLGLIFSAIMAGMLVIGLSLAFFAGTYAFLGKGHESWMAWLFWAIFVWWQVVPIFAAGFGANFSFRSLLRFPLSPRAFYLIGLAYGFADFAAVAALCWLFAILAAVAAAKPVLLPVALLAVLLFVLLNVTLERLTGSWLERLLSQRRSREIFFAFFILLVVGLQFVSPVMQKYGSILRPLARSFLPYLRPLPPSLAARAIAANAYHHWGVVVLCALGLAAYALFFSWLLWRRFSAQYRGEELSESLAPQAAKVAEPESAKSKPDFLHILPPQVATVLRKEFRYLTRNGFASLTLLLPPALVLLFSIQFAGDSPLARHHAITPDLFFPGMMGYLVLMLMAPAYNCFAYEGKGVQTYFTAPTQFREVFLGKNAMLVSVLFMEVILCVGVLAIRVGLPSLPIFSATLLAIVFAVVGQLAIANWSSLTFPRKLEFGQFRGQRNSGMAVLIAFIVQICLGIVCGLILAISRWTNDPWLSPSIFAFLAGAALLGYWGSLNALSRLAESKKEVLIEALCR
jgi:ABC-2 type transport system permease protein